MDSALEMKGHADIFRAFHHSKSLIDLHSDLNHDAQILKEALRSTSGTNSVGAAPQAIVEELGREDEEDGEDVPGRKTPVWDIAQQAGMQGSMDPDASMADGEPEALQHCGLPAERASGKGAPGEEKLQRCGTTAEAAPGREAPAGEAAAHSDSFVALSNADHAMGRGPLSSPRVTAAIAPPQRQQAAKAMLGCHTQIPPMPHSPPKITPMPHSPPS